MARVTHVKRAQARYRTVPVLDEAGQQIIVPVMRKDGTPRLTKSGRAVTMKRTREDRTQPLPPLTCEACHEPIQVGTQYKHVTPKSGPYGGRQRNRHEACPNWKPWDLSNAWWARIAQATDQYETDAANAESLEDLEAARDGAAQAIRDLAQESRDTADNVREGFGHDTSTSEQADERADALESWADDVEQVEFPEQPDDEAECDECHGTGKVDAEPADDAAEDDECPECGGTGQVDNADVDEWLDEAREALTSVLSECPV